MMLVMLAGLLKEFAPTVAAHLLGSYGPNAIRLVTDVFGGHKDDIPAVINAIMTDPEVEAKLASLEIKAANELQYIADKVESKL